MAEQFHDQLQDLTPEEMAEVKELSRRDPDAVQDWFWDRRERLKGQASAKPTPSPTPSAGTPRPPRFGVK